MIVTVRKVNQVGGLHLNDGIRIVVNSGEKALNGGYPEFNFIDDN